LVLTTAALSFALIRSATDDVVNTSRRDVEAIARLLAYANDFVSDISSHTEEVVGDHMLAEARLTAQLVSVAEGRAHLSPTEINTLLTDIADQTLLDEFRITDAAGHAYLTNLSQDFTFSPDPLQQPQMSIFWDLLQGNAKAVIQEARPREGETGLYKYVGVSGLDKPRIVQVGYSVSFLQEMARQVVIQRLVDRLTGQGDIAFIRILNDDNTTLVTSSSPLPNYDRAPTEADWRLISLARQDRLEHSELVGDVLIAAAPMFTVQGDSRGVVLVYQTTDRIQATARAAGVRGVGLMALALLIGVLAAIWLARSIARPLQQLDRAAQALARGDWQQEIQPSSINEIDVLGKAFVSMAAQLKDSYGQLENKVAALTTLQQASLRLSAVLNQADVMETVVSEIQALIGATDVRTFYYDTEHDQLTIGAARSTAQGTDQFDVAPRPGGLTYQVAHSGQLLVINEPATHPLYADMIAQWPLTAIIGLPLNRADRTLAVLNVAFVNQTHVFTDDEVGILTVLAEQTALALENARLYTSAQQEIAERKRAEEALHQVRDQLEIRVDERTAELDKRVGDLDLITRVGRYATLMHDRNTLLPAITDLIRAAFDYYAVIILLADKTTGTMYLNAISTIEKIDLREAGLGLAFNAQPSMIGHVIATGKSLVANDVSLEPLYHYDERFPRTRSELSLPLRVSDEVLGALDLESAQLNAFSPEDVQVLQILADQLAVAIHNASLFQAEAEARRMADTLREVGRVVGSTLNLDEVLDLILASLSTVLTYDSSTALLLKDDALYIESVHGFANPETVRGFRMPLSDYAINRQIVETSQPMVFADVTLDPRWQGGDTTPGSGPIRAWMGIPLIATGRIVGMLTIDSQQPGKYTPADLPLVTAFANQVAIALENARLFEAAQAARAQAEEADRLKSRFLANMSHELRTPLNSVINFAYLLTMGTEGPLNPGQEDLLNRIGDAGRHLLGLINDILDLAKIESGRLELYFEEVDLHELIGGVLSTAAGLLHDKPIELRREVPNDLPPVKADRTRVRQVLLNLLSNAAKFTDHGHITLRAAFDEAWVTLSVQDTGIGMAAEDIPKSFSEFIQLDSDLTRQAGGTGLGLPISKRFVEMHGGQIWVESQPGVGSTFYFTLPRLPVPLPTGLEPEVTEARVLVIDDDPVAREMIGVQLAHGYQVFKLSDSRLAVEKAREQRPDVIILDIMMPHQDGWEVLKLLKADPETKNIPVVVCSILREQNMALTLQADEYLAKPVDQEELRRVVEQFAPPGGKVLAVDDDPDALEIVRRMLGGMAYRVTTAPDGSIGLAAAQDQSPDVVVLDLMMPGLSGFEVLAALRADPRTANIPIVIVTAKDLTIEEQLQLQAEAATLLQKGQFNADEFAQTIRRAVARGNQQSNLRGSNNG
jgi:signal transduction histidine kinase/DNA-binding response OmpR family regulator/HAMP domain-containing protein